MKILLILLIVISTNLYSNNLTKNLELKFIQAKKLIKDSCSECLDDQILGLKNYIKATKILEDIVNKSDNFDLKFKALILLGNTYIELSVIGEKSKRNYYSDTGHKYLQQVLNNKTCLNPEAIFSTYAYKKKNINEKLNALKPLLDLQSSLFNAKYLEGKLLIEKGEIIEGLKSLEVSVKIASLKDLKGIEFSLAGYLYYYEKKDLAYEIMQKAHPKMTKINIDRILNKK